MLLLEDRNDGVAVYRIEDGRDVGINRYITTTPHTRAICNDPTVCGVDYTRRLQRACTSVLELYRRFASVPLECRETVVLNILPPHEADCRCFYVCIPSYAIQYRALPESHVLFRKGKRALED